MHEIQAQQQNLDAATIAAISAAGAVASANVAEVGQDITNFAAIDLTNAGLEDIAGDEEATKELNIMVQVFLSVIPTKIIPNSTLSSIVSINGTNDSMSF